MQKFTPQRCITTEHLFNVRDVASRLKVSVRTVWKLAATRKLPPPLRIGGARRWKSSDVENFIERLADKRDRG